MRGFEFRQNLCIPVKRGTSEIAELGQLLEEAVLNLPDQYRTVVMRRDIEGLSTAETATALDLIEENIKVRLHRGRALMRDWLFDRVGGDARNAFAFMGARCDRSVAGVFARIAEELGQFPFQTF